MANRLLHGRALIFRGLLLEQHHVSAVAVEVEDLGSFELADAVTLAASGFDLDSHVSLQT